MSPHRLTVMVLLWAVSTACSSTRVVRPDTGPGDTFIHVPQTDEVGLVELEEEEFTRAVAKEARSTCGSARLSGTQGIAGRY